MSQSDPVVDTPKLLVVDLEATCWGPGEHRPGLMETIEIGAVLLDAVSLDELGEYDRFVRPVRRPELSAFCTGLTTIRQEDVAHAAAFPEVFADFLAWAGPPEELTFASWGEYDRKQFRRDCSHHRVRYPFVEPELANGREVDRHLNLKVLFADRMGVTRRGVKPALATLGLTFEGTHHRGLDDARNIARVLRGVVARAER